ncbi:MAG TPA: acetate--CoA ligase family protein [Thermoanaerobaculia bacterium]|nr:acetate--CoA ligase family protein [Thermoanaerobaculia bacterium]
MSTLAPRSLDPIFSPASVAVIGASRSRDSIGFALVHNLVLAEFAGTIYPINPKAASVHSLKAYPSVLDVPDPIDLAVIAVPRDIVPAVVDECLEKGVRGLVTITAGFSETGDEGAALEAEILEKIRAAGVRMVGPNCMGVINTDDGVSMNATFAPTPARRGSIGFVSQSGALGVAILNVAADLGIGLTQFASMGNKADVSGNDLLEHWEDDPATRVIAMYLESFGNPRRFTEIAKRVGRKKPILVVKSGRTSEGARAATSHTGAIAGTDVTVSAFLDQCGVLRATTIEELFDVARALDRCPLPRGHRVAIVTNAGGPAIMATDACVNLGLEMAELSQETVEELRSFLPAEASVANPVDMIASATADGYRRTLETVLADPGVDLAMAINVTPLLTSPDDVLTAINEVEACFDEPGERGGEGGKPVLVVMMATEDFYERVKLDPEHPPVYRFPESAARALSMLARYAAWRRRPDDAPAPEFEVDDAAVARELERVDDGYLPPDAAHRVLDLYGVPLARWRLVEPTADAAVVAAGELGWPVVLKAVAADLVHKSDVGAVAVDLEDEAELREACEEIAASVGEAGHALDGFLVQEMVRGGHEVIFGISTDPRFGPLLMFGLGGKYVEVFQDVRFGVTPLDRMEAREMIRGIRGVKLLEGVRGESAADFALLEEVLLRLAQLAQRHPRLRELDVNPFLASGEVASAKALDVRIRVGTPGTTD